MAVEAASKNKKFKYVPPEGGYGYFICLAFVINVSAASMFLGCFGLIFDDFMKEIGMNSTTTTILTGLNAISFSFSGFFTNSVLKVLSKRQLTMLSSLVFLAGNLGMVFANSIPLFYICGGVLPGLNVGWTMNTICTLMNEYFHKHRLFAFSFVQLIVAALAMVAPMFVKWSLENYGFRGTMLLIVGISLHTIFGVFLMHPVEWHMKKVEIPEESEMQLLLIDGKDRSVPVVQVKNIANEVSEEKITVEPTDVETKSAFLNFINSLIDWPFLKKFIISCACLGPALSNFSESTFALILPQALYNHGWNQRLAIGIKRGNTSGIMATFTPGTISGGLFDLSMVAFAISLYSLGDLIMRIIMTFGSKWLLKVGSQEVYIIGLIIGIFGRLGLLWSQNDIALYIYIVLIGASKATICVLVSIVISDVVSPEKFSEALGIYMLVCGSIVPFLGPAIGGIRDLTDSYSTAFYLLTSVLAIVVLFWSIELIYKRNSQKRKDYEEKLKMMKIKGKQ